MLAASWCCQRILFVVTIALLFCAVTRPASALSQSEKKWAKLQREGTESLDANKYWIAEPTLKEALIQAGNFGMRDLRLAKSFGELGRLYTVRARFGDAEPYLEEELYVKKQALGEKSGQIIPAMGCLIQFYLAYGTANKAYPLTEEMLDLIACKSKETQQMQVKFRKGMTLEGWCGMTDRAKQDQLLDWAITCDAVGNDYRACGKFDLADRLFKAALDLKATFLGKNHLSLANSYDSLGILCLKRNEFGDAESYFRDALAVTEKTLSSESHEVYVRLDRLAKCLMKRRKYQEAEELYLRAQIFWKKEPSKYGDESRALYALGSLYAEEKKYSAAAGILQRALRLAERYSGPSSIELVPYLQRYAYVLYYLGRKPETEQLRARADRIAGPK